jgi:hypothetical protein
MLIGRVVPLPRNLEHGRGSPADPLVEKLEEKLKGMLEHNAHEQIAPLPSPDAV